MSLKNTKNLLIVAAVVVAVLAGTVLLGNYTNILSTGSQPIACQATKSSTCTASQAFFADSAEEECTRKAECGSAEKTCPLDPTKPCCAVEGTPGCCPKTDCPADCDKPCCVESGSCPKTEASGCCPKADATAAAKTGCCPVTVATTE